MEEAVARRMVDRTVSKEAARTLLRQAKGVNLDERRDRERREPPLPVDVSRA